MKLQHRQESQLVQNILFFTQRKTRDTFLSH